MITAYRHPPSAGNWGQSLFCWMTAAGLLVVRDGPSERGKPRKYYRLTHQGQGRLVDLMGHWNAIHSAIESLSHDTDG